MDILMSETCWAHNKWNKVASDIKLVFHSSAIEIYFEACKIFIRIMIRSPKYFLDFTKKNDIIVPYVASTISRAAHKVVVICWLCYTLRRSMATELSSNQMANMQNYTRWWMEFNGKQAEGNLPKT